MIQVWPDGKHECKKADLGTSSRWSFVVVTCCHHVSPTVREWLLESPAVSSCSGPKDALLRVLSCMVFASKQMSFATSGTWQDKRLDQQASSEAFSCEFGCSNLFPSAWHRLKLAMMTMLGGTSRQRVWYWRSFQQKFQMLLNAHMGEKMLLQTVRRMTEFTEIPSNSQELFCLNHAQQTQQIQDRFGSVSISPSLFSQQHFEWMERFVRQPHCSIRASCLFSLFASFHACPRDSTLLTVMLSIYPATADRKNIHRIDDVDE